MAIDIHAHAVPMAALAELRRHPAAFPSIRWEALPGPDGQPRLRLKFPGEPWTRPVPPGLTDWDRRRRWMAEHGITRQWVSGWLDLFGPGLPPREAAAWCRCLNDAAAWAMGGDPAFVGSATLPLQEPALAVAELRHAVEDLGFRVVTIPTVPAYRGSRPVELADPVFDPFWEAAAALRVPVIVHPGYAGDEPRLADYDLANIVGRAAETTLAVTRLLFAGTLARFPDLRLVLVHGGGFLPYHAGRIAHGYQLAGAGKGQEVLALLRRLYYDSLVMRPQALRLLLEVAGDGQVMLGTDYPFALGDLDPWQLLAGAGLEGAVQARIGHAVAEGLLAEVKAGPGPG